MPAERREPAGHDASATRPMAQVDGGPFVLPEAAPATLIDALTRAAETAGDRGTTYVLADDSDERQTYRDLLVDAARVVPGLREQGLAPGDSVLLHCDDNRNFVTGFWACLLGGFVPTPLAMAPTYQWENATTRRLRNVWDLLDQPPIVTDAAWAPQVAGLRSLWGTTAPRILAMEQLRAAEPTAEPYPARPDDPVVHLLTSGSTGVPKCVRHTNRSVISRAYVNAMANNFGQADVTLNFMPLDHVAGMVMHNLRDVILRCEHVNARTASFIADPLRWFTWIERYRVTNTSAPNFVITLVNTFADEISRRRWDLSSLRDITNGGEPIVSSAMHEFLRLFAPHGMAPAVMRPAWGMSEMCGGVVHSTLNRDDEKAGVITVDTRTMGGTLAVLPAPTPGHPTFTEVGVPVPGTSLRIVDRDGHVLPEDHIGRLHVRGVTRMAGYHNNPEANRESFTADGWFDTGDLAFVHNGRLVVTGREKDTIVIRSANYHCHEIESVVGRVDGVLPTFVAACGEHDAGSGTDELLVFCVLTPDAPDARRNVIDAIGARLSREVGLRPHRVVPVRREAFPRTSAGKVERHRLLADYRAGAFDDELAAVARAGDGTAGDDNSDEARPWLFRTVWLPQAPTPGPLPAGTWLIFGHADLAGRIRARRGHGSPPVVSVTPAAGYRRLSELEYEIDPADPASYAELMAAVRREHGPVDAIVHGWAASTVEGLAGGLRLSAPSVHSLIKACADTRPLLLVVTTGAHPTDDTDPVEPVHATINGLVRTANAEGATGGARQVDLHPDDPDPASAVLAELADQGHDDVVARRGGKRLVPRIRPLSDAPGAVAHPIRPGGLYLLTGGLGRIGFRLARLLLAEHGADLVLVGRSAPTGSKAARLAQLGELGRVAYHQADVADAEALRETVDAAEARSGRTLDGVLHLAGADISGLWGNLESHLLCREQAAEFERMYRAKVLGTEAIAAVLRDRPGTHLVLFSSVNGHFGGTAFGAYASASGFLVAFAQHWRRLGRPVQCQAWSLWAEPGEASPGRAAVERQGFRPIEPEHGVHLFQRVLADPAAHVLIGLDDRNEHIARELDPAFLDHVDVTEPSAAEGGAAEAAEPVGEFEHDVADIWRKTFGAQSVGRDDHFFELGGTSLTAIRLVERLNTAFGCRLAVHHLYEHPTVRKVSRLIGALSPAQGRE